MAIRITNKLDHRNQNGISHIRLESRAQNTSPTNRHSEWVGGKVEYKNAIKRHFIVFKQRQTTPVANDEQIVFKS